MESIASVEELLASKKRAMSSSELALILGVSERQIQVMVQNDRLPAHRIGKLLKFCPKTTASWWRSKSTAA